MRAVVEQITRISCGGGRDPKTYTDSNALLNSICAFDFVSGLFLLKVVLSNTDSLSKYLQSKNMDVTTAKKTADSCNDQNSRRLGKLWQVALRKKFRVPDFHSKMLQPQETRLRRVDCRSRRLIGESSTTTQHQQPTAESHYWIKTFFLTLDKVILETQTHFQSNDQDILCALAGVVFSQKPSKGSFALVSSFYSLDSSVLEAEVQTFRNFLSDNPVPHKIKRAAAVVKTLYENGLYNMFGRKIFQWVAKSEDVPSFHNGSRTFK